MRFCKSARRARPKIARRFNGGLAVKGRKSPRRGRLNGRRSNVLQSPVMSHRYSSLLVHCAFSTKEREHLIAESMKRKLWAYIGGIARANQFKALAVGGMPDHVHALLSLPATLTVAKALPLIKGGSS